MIFEIVLGSIKPFNIKVQFGPGVKAESPEDNLGMCLKYEQVPCSWHLRYHKKSL